jgi:hypothetical protein
LDHETNLVLEKETYFPSPSSSPNHITFDPRLQGMMHCVLCCVPGEKVKIDGVLPTSISSLMHSEGIIPHNYLNLSLSRERERERFFLRGMNIVLADLGLRHSC